MEETEKGLLFVQMALDDARDKGNDKYVVPALIKMGLLHFQMASQCPKEQGKAKDDNLAQAEKYMNECLFEAKRLRFDVEPEQMVLIRERLCSVAEHKQDFKEM